MPNQPDESKRKVTYQENKDVYNELVLQANEETATWGEVVAPAELIRRGTKLIANANRERSGEPKIDYDEKSGPFAPRNIVSATLAIMNSPGDMAVYDKKGNKMKGWDNVKDIPKLLRSYPRCELRFSESLELPST
jgi:hypothetical protein